MNGRRENKDVSLKSGYEKQAREGSGRGRMCSWEDMGLLPFFFNLNFISLFDLLISFLGRKYLRLFEKEIENMRNILINETRKHDKAIWGTQLRLLLPCYFQRFLEEIVFKLSPLQY